MNVIEAPDEYIGTEQPLGLLVESKAEAAGFEGSLAIRLFSFAAPFEFGGLKSWNSGTAKSRNKKRSGLGAIRQGLRLACKLADLLQKRRHKPPKMAAHLPSGCLKEVTPVI